MSSIFKTIQFPLKSEKKTEKYRFEKTSCQVLRKMNEFFQDQTLCDVTLIASCKTKIEAHRVVLSASCECFRAMFCVPLKEARDAEVKLDQVDGKTLKILVNSIYNASVELDADTAENVFKAANFFQIEQLEAACCDFLTKQLDPCNCLGIWLLAEEYNNKQLLEASLAYTMEHFMELRSYEEFFLLEADQLSKLLCNDELRVPSEEEVFHSLMDWVNYDKTNRKDFYQKLIGCVRLPLLLPLFINGNIEKSDMSTGCSELCMSAYKWHLMPKLRLSLLPDDQLGLRSHKDCMIAISGWSNPEHVLHVGLYYAGYNEWLYREWPGLPQVRDKFGSVAVDGKLIIAGGVFPNGRITNRVYSLDLRTLLWDELAPLKTGRHSLAMTSINGAIYAAGGHDGTNTLSVLEKLDPLTGLWVTEQPLPVALENPRLGVKNGRLVVSRSSQTSTTTNTYNQGFQTIQIPGQETRNGVLSVLSNGQWTNWMYCELDLLGMVTLPINEKDHFISISRTEVRSVNLKDDGITITRVNMDKLTNCIVFGKRIIAHEQTTFLEYGEHGTFKAMPSFRNDQGDVVLISC